MVNSGHMDGEMHRVRDFAKLVGEGAENLVRIDTKLFDVFTAVFARKGHRTKNILAVEDLRGSNVAYRGGRKNIERILSPIKPKIGISITSSDENAFRMLARRHVDYVLAASWESKLTFSKSPEDFHSLHEVGRLAKVGLYAYVHKKHSEIAKKVSSTLAEMNADKISDNIISSIIGADPK